MAFLTDQKSIQIHKIMDHTSEHTFDLSLPPTFSLRGKRHYHNNDEHTKWNFLTHYPNSNINDHVCDISATIKTQNDDEYIMT